MSTGKMTANRMKKSRKRMDSPHSEEASIFDSAGFAAHFVCRHANLVYGRYEKTAGRYTYPAIVYAVTGTGHNGNRKEHSRDG